MLHPVETAAQVHGNIATVHPFVDGNGRTARLVMNLLLLRAGFPLLRIQPESRQFYFAALEASRYKSPEAFLSGSRPARRRNWTFGCGIWIRKRDYSQQWSSPQFSLSTSARRRHQS